MTRKDPEEAPPAETPEGEQPTDAVTEEVQAKVDKETEQGFRGTPVDPTDDHAYTVAGVVAGEPTPETDPDHARQVRAELDPR